MKKPHKWKSIIVTCIFLKDSVTAQHPSDKSTTLNCETVKTYGLLMVSDC